MQWRVPGILRCLRRKSMISPPPARRGNSIRHDVRCTVPKVLPSPGVHILLGNFRQFFGRSVRSIRLGGLGYGFTHTPTVLHTRSKIRLCHQIPPGEFFLDVAMVGLWQSVLPLWYTINEQRCIKSQIQNGQMGC